MNLDDHPIALDAPPLQPTLAELAAAGARGIAARPEALTRRPRISVGIVNNMPDAALQATERQFVTFLEAGAIDFDLRLHLFSLPGIPRSGEARDRIKNRYLDYDVLSELHMDALIVTGAVPKSGKLSAEPFWPRLTELADWASTRTLSVLWSCLSAHAAVQHLDGIERQPLPRKLSGLYNVETCAEDAALAGVGAKFWQPHSRYNDVPEYELRSAGYKILSRSDAVGADIFTKTTPSWFVFWQGHPEYDGDSLMREYRRDIMQYLNGERGGYPGMPENYFEPAVEAALQAFAGKAQAGRRPALAAQFPDLRGAVPHFGIWHSAATKLFHNWIGQVALLKSQQFRRQGAAA
jgi:homoserine O-succinyltransferase